MPKPPTSGTTERVRIPVKGGVEEWGEPLKHLLLTLKVQPGIIRHRWGPTSEDPNMLELMVGWTTEEARKNFLASADHEKAIEALKPVLAGEPQAYGIKFEPYAPRDAIDSPVVELITIHGCEGEDHRRLSAHFEQVMTLDGVRGAACGWSLSDDVVNAATGSKGRVWIAATGWSSIEKAKETDKSVYIPDCGSGSSMQTCHVNYNFPIKGFGITNSVH